MKRKDLIQYGQYRECPKCFSHSFRIVSVADQPGACCKRCGKKWQFTKRFSEAERKGLLHRVLQGETMVKAAIGMNIGEKEVSRIIYQELANIAQDIRERGWIRMSTLLWQVDRERGWRIIGDMKLSFRTIGKRDRVCLSALVEEYWRYVAVET